MIEKGSEAAIRLHIDQVRPSVSIHVRGKQVSVGTRAHYVRTENAGTSVAFEMDSIGRAESDVRTSIAIEVGDLCRGDICDWIVGGVIRDLREPGKACKQKE